MKRYGAKKKRDIVETSHKCFYVPAFKSKKTARQKWKKEVTSNALEQ
jgi:hypothetical protein